MPGPKIKTDRACGGLNKSPFSLHPYGESGLEVGDIFPGIGNRIDDLLVVRSMWSGSVNHLPSMLMMDTGHALRGGSRPPLGSWIVYHLGSENQSLPGFVVLCPGKPVCAARHWSASFLPAIYQGALVQNDEEAPDKLIRNIADASSTRDEQRSQLDLSECLDAQFPERVGYYPKLRGQHRVDEYGDFGRGCLLALRPADAGARLIQMYYGHSRPRDSHDAILTQGGPIPALRRFYGALPEYLKDRGMLDETPVILGNEFGRTPMIQSSGTETVDHRRDHNPPGYSILLAGGGIRGDQALRSHRRLWLKSGRQTGDAARRTRHRATSAPPRPDQAYLSSQWARLSPDRRPWHRDSRLHGVRQETLRIPCCQAHARSTDSLRELLDRSNHLSNTWRLANMVKSRPSLLLRAADAQQISLQNSNRPPS